MGQFQYGVVRMNEEFFEDVVVEHLVDELGYEHLYGPSIERTDDRYRDIFLPDVLPAALARINPGLPRAAVQEAIEKLNNVEGGSLEQRNGMHVSLVSVAVWLQKLTFAHTNVII